MKINGQPEGGQGGGLTPQQEALINQVPNKVNQVRLVTDGSAIRYEGALTPLTFNDIYTLVMDNSKYVYIVMDNNIRFRPSAYDGDAIWFDSTFIEEGKPNILRCIINSDNQVSVDQIVVASEDYVDKHAGGLTPEQKKAVDTLTDSSEGMLYTNEIKSLDYYNNYVAGESFYIQCMSNEHTTPGEVYFTSNGKLYKFDYESLSVKQISDYKGHLSNDIVWKDNSGRYYNYHSQIDVETGNKIKDVEGIVNVISMYSYATTLFRFGDELLNIYGANLQRFNESTQTFEVMNLDTTLGIPFPDMIMYYEGDLIAPVHNLKLVKVDDTSYKWEEYTAPFETSLPTGYEFSGLDNIHYVEGVGYVFANRNDYSQLYKLVDGHWETLEFHSVDGAVSGGNFMTTSLIGGLIIGHTSTEITLVNAGNDVKSTAWIDGKTKFVDLTSSQNIRGNKRFVDAISANDIYTDNVGSNGNLFINAFDNIKIVSGYLKDVSVTSGRFLSNGTPVATLDDTIITQDTTYIGPDFKQVMTQYTPGLTYGTVVKVGNRVFHLEYGISFEFVGNNWEPRSFEFNFMESYRTFKKTNNKTYFVNPENNYIYEFTGDEFILRAENPYGYSYEQIFPLGDDLYTNGGSHKLNTTTWEWEELEQTIYTPYNAFNVKVLNGEAYSFANNHIHKFNESTQSFEEIVNGYSPETYFGWINSVNVFTYESDVYFVSNEGIFKLNTENNTIEKQNIYHIEDAQYDGYFEYDGKLFVSYGGSTGYTYYTTYTKPEIPEADGSYVLKATRVGDKITYTWVAE